MDYFFVDPKDVVDRVAVIRGDEFKHLSRVLRKKEGEPVVLLDGEDNWYEAVIQHIGKTHAECEVLSRRYRVNEPRVEITLGVSLLRNPARFDVLVEKATELGVRTIVPLLCERTIPRNEKHSRLEKIALSAMKQCGRSYLPRILELTPLEEVLQRGDEYSLRLVPHEKTEQSQFVGTVLQHHPNAASVLIVVGPVGAFTESEIATAAVNGFVPISLGPRRLRSETAAISAITWIVGSW